MYVCMYLFIIYYFIYIIIIIPIPSSPRREFFPSERSDGSSAPIISRVDYSRAIQHCVFISRCRQGGPLISMCGLCFHRLDVPGASTHAGPSFQLIIFLFIIIFFTCVFFHFLEQSLFYYFIFPSR